MPGQYCGIAGHLEADETIEEGVIREAREEAEVDIDPADLGLPYVMHYRTPEGEGRLGFFFVTRCWTGEPQVGEKDKCAGLLWCDPRNLPTNTVPYTVAAIAQILADAPFSVAGSWPERPAR